ncbi:YceI family protein, partial [Geminicoccus flavidas]|uniref:YceI family protein n=1 Tax=Geminicoccus flavidas TaxID=2506407 RepID=UPI0038B2E12B
MTVVLLLLAAPRADAAVRNYAIDPDRIRIEFIVDATGLAAATGTMRVHHGELLLDPDQPEQARLELVLDAASLDMAFPDWDEVIRGTSFL